MLTYVETGNADAGIVYLTDARISSKVRVVATAPADSHEPIVYPAAILKSRRTWPPRERFSISLPGPMRARSL